MFEITIDISGHESTLRLGEYSSPESITMAFKCRNKAEAHEFVERAMTAYQMPTGREELE